MPANSATARLIIEVRDGQATRSLRRVNRRMSRLERTARRLGRTMRSLTVGGFGRLIKSTLSAVSRLAVLGVIIGIPIAAFGGLISIISATIRSLSEFEQRILGLQAILASSVVFLQDPVENFRNAGLVAIGVIEKLSLRANEMVTSLSEATIVFQTLLATGAQRLVSDVDRLVDLTILLSNSIAGITTGQDRQRQLAEETRSLFTGQLRSTSLLARLIFRNRREMLRFFMEAEATDTVVERLAERLRGFSLIARDLARTLEGLKTTFVTLLQVIARRAFAGLLASLEGTVGDIFDTIQADIEGLNNLAARLAAAVRISITAITDVIGRVFGISLSNTDNLLQRITDAVPTVTRGFLYILFVIEDIGTSLKIVLEILKIVGSLLQLLFQGVRLIFDAITLIIGLIPGASGLLSALYSNLAAIDNVIGDIAKNFGRIAALSNNLLNGASLRARVDAIIAGLAEEEAKQLERIRREQELIGEAESNISSRRRVDLTTLIRTTSEMLKQSAALRSQVSSVKQIISLTLQGGLPRGVRALVSGNVIGLADQVRAQIADLVKVLLSAETLLTRANLFSSIADPDDIKKLELQIERVKGEILALGADLIALNAIFADIAETTVAAFTRILSRDVSAVVFGNLLSFLRGEATSLTSVFMGLTASIKEFITSAEVQVALIAAIGNALSNAITQAIQGARSLGEALKGILGGILIAIGQLLIQMGSASLLFGIITLNAQAVAYGLLAIAAGTAAIAVGSAIGGSGGGGGGGGGGGTATSAGSPTFTFRQQDIVTQQLSSATEGLRITSENLNEATKNIGGVKPGEVFTKGADQAGGITRVLANDVRRGDRFTATRDAALAFGGS